MSGIHPSPVDDLSFLLFYFWQMPGYGICQCRRSFLFPFEEGHLRSHRDAEMQDASTLIPKPVRTATVDGRESSHWPLTISDRSHEAIDMHEKVSTRSTLARRKPETTDPRRRRWRTRCALRICCHENLHSSWLALGPLFCPLST